MPTTRRSKHADIRANLILAIDIGTTFSAVSYCIVSSKQKLGRFVFNEVNRWPKQLMSNAKIPSIIYYDQRGTPQVVGAEKHDEALIVTAEYLKWEKVEWWKLLLRPQDFALTLPEEVSPLPYGISVDNILKDFLVYMKANVRDFITIAHGKQFWEDLESSVDVVLTAPNGWDGRTQQRMRKAATSAQLVGPEEGNRIRFLSEGEAGIHYCMDNAKLASNIIAGSVVLVCDAGGGTTDIGVKCLEPLSLEEITSPSSFLAGGVYVDKRARNFMIEKLTGSQWGGQKSIDYAVSLFERVVKRQFEGPEVKCYLALNGHQGSDYVHGVYEGRLIIPRDDMMSFFEPSLSKIKQELFSMIQRGLTDINHIFLVGGFSESPYVFDQIKRWAATCPNTFISKPDNGLSKAIPHGALRWYVNSAVQTRVARLHYGAETTMKYEANNADMAGRGTFKSVTGEYRVCGAWKSIVKKEERIRSMGEHTAWFHQNITESDSKEVEMKLYAYRWDSPPMFCETSDQVVKDGFLLIGVVTANLEQCFKAARFRPSTSPTGQRYKSLDYQVCLSFGEAEIQARLKWKENKTTKTGKATILYDL